MVFSVVVRILMLQQPTESCSSNKGTQMRNKRKDMVSINNYSTYIIYVYIYISVCVWAQSCGCYPCSPLPCTLHVSKIVTATTACFPTRKLEQPHIFITMTRNNTCLKMCWNCIHHGWTTLAKQPSYIQLLWSFLIYGAHQILKSECSWRSLCTSFWPGVW